MGKDTSEEPKTTLKVVEHKNEEFSTNTELEDSFGNKITVPAGFKITSDSPDNVTGGIVIEDADSTRTTLGSQFVWIPVGDVYTDANGTKTNIELCRCGFNENGEKVTVEEGWEYQITKMIELGMPEEYANQYRTYTFTEDTESREGSTSEDINATAKNLSDFRTKASKGYYIGRYEARKDSNGNVTEKASDSVYNNVSQLQASSIARNMYTGSNFDSDLVNSYAWDTAILFLQQFDDRADKTTKYSLQPSLNSSFATTGTTADKICNVYDMTSNCSEWTTETISETSSPAVNRGDIYGSGGFGFTAQRSYQSSVSYSEFNGFRPILYL